VLLRNQRGYSLLELIVVIVITGAIAVPLSTFAIKGLTSYTYLEAQSNTSIELNTLSNRIAKVVRGATSVDTAQANTLIVFGYFSPQDTVIKKIKYYLTGTNLDIDIIPPTNCDAQGANCQYLAPERTLVTRVDLTNGATPIFTYYDDVGIQLSGAFLTSQIKQVGIYISANPKSKQVPVPISLSTKVTLRNLKVNL
jgi:prepilin-type N-terminal cleavage/methylation domain-containing protein